MRGKNERNKSVKRRNMTLNLLLLTSVTSLRKKNFRYYLGENDCDSVSFFNLKF